MWCEGGAGNDRDPGRISPFVEPMCRVLCALLYCYRVAPIDKVHCQVRHVISSVNSRGEKRKSEFVSSA